MKKIDRFTFWYYTGNTAAIVLYLVLIYLITVKK